MLAAWYFSEKRRPTCVRLGGPATPVHEDIEDKITRLTDEIETRQAELAAAEAELLKKMESEAEESVEASEPTETEETAS